MTKRISTDTRAKMSQAHMGRSNFKGRSHSEDAKQRIADGMRRYHAGKRAEKPDRDISISAVDDAISLLDRAIKFFKTR